MAGQWKQPLSFTQKNSRNFFFGPSSSTPWNNDLCHRDHCRLERHMDEVHRRTPMEEKVVPPAPWAVSYDATMRPWSPFAGLPQVPQVQPRTAMLLMRKMLLSNPAAGITSNAAHLHAANSARVQRAAQVACLSTHRLRWARPVQAPPPPMPRYLRRLMSHPVSCSLI